MDGYDTSSTLSSWDPDERGRRNVLNPMFWLFCHVHFGVPMESYFPEDVVRWIAFSCHCPLDLLCGKTELYYSPFLTLAFAATLPCWSNSLGHFV